MANRIRQMVKKPNTKSDEIKDNNIICNEIYRKDIISRLHKVFDMENYGNVWKYSPFQSKSLEWYQQK